MRLLDYLQHAYIINLPARSDRRRGVRAELKRVDIDPEDPRVQIFEATRPQGKGGFPTIGTRGCYMSHLGVLKHARDQGHERVWIMEDDVCFDPRWRDIEQDLVRQFEIYPDWWIGYLGWATPGQAPRLGTGSPLLEPSAEAVTHSHCWAVQRHAFDPMIAYLDSCLSRPKGHPDGGPMHVDGAFARFRQRNPEAKTLICKPGVATQRSSRTDIHDLRLVDRLPIVREAMQFLRGSKQVAVRLGLLRP